MNYEEVQFCRVVGSNVKFMPYLGRPRGNALLEDLKYRRKQGGYVVAVYEGDALELTPECETHAEFCAEYLDDAPEAEKPVKKTRKRRYAKKTTAKEEDE